MEKIKLKKPKRYGRKKKKKYGLITVIESFKKKKKNNFFVLFSGIMWTIVKDFLFLFFVLLVCLFVFWCFN